MHYLIIKHINKFKEVCDKMIQYWVNILIKYYKCNQILVVKV